MLRAYYNEHDPFAASWLRNLIAAGHIADGDVDERSIEDVLPSDLTGYTQCHFFAGIGGWSLALRLAGWPYDRPVWTGSAPCQPFSAAGKGAGTADERHLWPAFHHLIKECRPPVVFGEQVEAAIRHGWRDLVQADLEGIGYAYGDAGLPAACVGAPHIRQRLFFVADANSGKRNGVAIVRRAECDWQDAGRAESCGCASACGEHGRLAHPEQHDHRRQSNAAHPGQPEGHGPADRTCGCGGASGRLGIPDNDGCNPWRTYAAPMGYGDSADPASSWMRPGPLDGLWRDADWIYCRDDKWRPVEPGTFPLAHGIPACLGRGKSTLGGMARSNRMGRLRGYGNAIVPQVAAEFIMAYIGAKK